MNAAIYTHATITHFASVLPNWNSLESVRRTHSALEAGALVFFALLVVSEALAHLSADKKKENIFDRIGICFFAIAVLAEIAAYPYGQRNDALSERIIGSLDEKARRADSNASKALTDSGTALSQAKDAITKTGIAEGAMKTAAKEALEAQTAASNALSIAHDARQEADSFEKDILSAKTQAADAESHLADALGQAAQATEELRRLKLPRSLTNATTLATGLRAFKGTEYTVIGCFQDQESIGLLVQIDEVLKNAGWTRVKPPPQNSYGDLQLNISKDFAVPITSRSGIYVVVQSTQTVDALRATQPPLLAAYIRAAMALKGGLASSVNPEEADLQTPLQVDPGSSTSVFIIVGKKP